MRLVKGGGYPKFHLFPTFVRWGPNLSVFWFRTEYVLLDAFKIN